MIQLKLQLCINFLQSFQQCISSFRFHIVHNVDSKIATMGLGLLVIAAARMVEVGEVVGNSLLDCKSA